MGTIKFRAKNLDGEWVYGFYVEEDRQTLNGFEKKYLIVNDDGHHYVKPETVGQFTGFLDKDGNEIYKDDFLTLVVELFGVVRWHEDGYFFIDDSIAGFASADTYKPLGEMIRFFNNVNAAYFVSGNIHDNPELQKVCEL